MANDISLFVDRGNGGVARADHARGVHLRREQGAPATGVYASSKLVQQKMWQYNRPRAQQYVGKYQ